jgi:hypothetical protein
MSHKVAIDGQSFLVRGFSKTQIGHVQSGGTPIHEPNPNIEKTIYTAGQPPTYPGHIRNTFGSATPDSADRILNDASTRPHARAPGSFAQDLSEAGVSFDNPQASKAQGGKGASRDPSGISKGRVRDVPAPGAVSGRSRK